MNRKVYMIGMSILLAVAATGCSSRESVKDSRNESDTAISSEDIGREEEQKDWNEMMKNMAETSADAYSIAAIENEDQSEKYYLIPTRYPVYHDGRSHRLMFGADEKKYYYDNFTEISLPEYHITAISLPTIMTDQMSSPIQLDETSRLPVEEFEIDQLYDTSGRYSDENQKVLSIETTDLYFRAWKVPYPDNKNIDYDEIKKLGHKNGWYRLYPNLEISKTELPDNSISYELPIGAYDYADESRMFPGTLKIIVHDGMAYCYLVGCRNPMYDAYKEKYILDSSFEF